MNRTTARRALATASGHRANYSQLPIQNMLMPACLLVRRGVSSRRLQFCRAADGLFLVCKQRPGEQPAVPFRLSLNKTKRPALVVLDRQQLNSDADIRLVQPNLCAELPGTVYSELRLVSPTQEDHVIDLHLRLVDLFNSSKSLNVRRRTPYNRLLKSGRPGTNIDAKQLTMSAGGLVGNGRSESQQSSNNWTGRGWAAVRRSDRGNAAYHS